MGGQSREDVACSGVGGQSSDIEVTCVTRGEARAIGHADIDGVFGREGIDMGAVGLEIMTCGAGVGDGKSDVWWGTANRQSVC